MYLGSPPRLRGKGGITAYFPQLFGITPAFAGKSVKEKLSKGGGKDHPRVCGEKPMPMPFTVVVLGSPPRIRGKVNDLHSGRKLVGITPAFAGKSWPCGSGSALRGEKRKLVISCILAGGSPPRLRGKVDLKHFLHPPSSLRWAWQNTCPSNTAPRGTRPRPKH